MNQSRTIRIMHEYTERHLRYGGYNKNQHKWFNKKAKAKHLKEGDQVLLLIPTKLNKLEMQWQGPSFEIVKKMRENDYVINFDRQHNNLCFTPTCCGNI